MANTNFDLTNEEILNGVSFNFGDGDTPTPSTDASNSTVAFTQASTRTNITTGEKLSIICGKIRKFFADLKAVAFSGSYNDLSDKPNIPTVNNATLTIKQGGTTKGTFTANANTDVEIDLDAGDDVSNSTVTFTEAQTRTNIATGEKLSVICGKIKKFFTDLKAVAFSGDYADLINKPTIPTKTSQLTNDSGFSTFSGDYNDLTDKPNIPTVNNATLTIKQGGTTKGTFTANASENVTIDLDAGGGGSTYTAGAGIDITNNVISATNPIVKTDISLNNAVIPCLFRDATTGEDAPLTKEDGTTATLADCLDLGASTLNIGAQFLKYINNAHVSGSAKAYDYGTQKQTTLTYDENINGGTSQVYNSGSFGLFDESAQIIGGPFTSENISLQIVLGKANGHLYAFVYNGYFGTLSEQSYISSCTCTADVEFTQI